ncbi:MAG: MATE family efflux transporter, partial [Bacteroidales bacterium]|nr:MATE family efflux transporter [Bacteroidales bacterium]
FMEFSKKICGDIISIGMAPFVMNVCNCVIVILINNQLLKYSGDMAVGAYGIVNRLIMLFVMLVMGINRGMQPIAGFNFGAQIYSRVRSILRFTIIMAVTVTTFAFIIGESIPYYLTRMFTDDEELIEKSIIGFRITVSLFPIVGFQMVASNFFQSIGKAKMAIIVSATRQMIFLIPLLIILPPLLGSDGVWWSMPISDGISTVVAFFLLKREMKKLNKLEDKPFKQTI